MELFATWKDGKSRKPYLLMYWMNDTRARVRPHQSIFHLLCIFRGRQWGRTHEQEVRDNLQWRAEMFLGQRSCLWLSFTGCVWVRVSLSMFWFFFPCCSCQTEHWPPSSGLRRCWTHTHWACWPSFCRQILQAEDTKTLNTCRLQGLPPGYYRHGVGNFLVFSSPYGKMLGGQKNIASEKLLYVCDLWKRWLLILSRHMRRRMASDDLRNLQKTAMVQKAEKVEGESSSVFWIGHSGENKLQIKGLRLKLCSDWPERGREV